MRKDNRKSEINGVKVILYVLVLIAAVLVFGTIRSTSFNRMSDTNLLLQIRAAVLAYRLAELELVLSSDETERNPYIDRMIFEQRLLERKLRELEPILVTDEEKGAYTGFSADWKAFIKKSNPSPELAGGNTKRQADRAYTQKSRALYEKSARSLETLIKAMANAPESWSGLVRTFVVENRLSLVILYICGITFILAVLFKLYDKARRRMKS